MKISLRVARFAGAVVAVAALALVPTLDANADDVAPGRGSISWTVAAASATAPDGRISLRHMIKAGSTVEDFVAVTNYSATPASFRVYASDGVITADGNFDLLPRGTTPRDGGSWISIGTVDGLTQADKGGQVLSLAAGQSAVLPVAITVPKGASPGDHPAGIVAEYVQPDDSPVQTAARVGIRVHLRVDGKIVARLVPSITKTAYHPSWNPFAPGSVSVTYTLRNSGNVRIGSSTMTTVSGPFGWFPHATTNIRREILPGGDVVVTATLPVFPLFMSSGEVAVTPTAVGVDTIGAPHDSAASAIVWTVPWAQLILILLLVAAFLLVRFLMRRSRVRVQRRIDEAVALAEQSAAERVQEPSLEAPEN